MAATDQHYRNQTTLDVIFGVSCGAMLLTTVWMFVQDYSRSYKSIQRTFRDVEATIAERELVDKLPDPEQLRVKRIALRQARKGIEDAKAAAILDPSTVEAYRETLRSRATRDTEAGAKASRELAKAVEAFDARVRSLQASYDQADGTYRTIKADLDSKISLYNIEIDNAGKYPEDSQQAKGYRAAAGKLKEEINSLETQLAAAKEQLDRVDAEIKEKVRAPLEPAEKAVAAAEEEMKKLAGTSDRFAKMAAQKAWSTSDTFRALPIIDGFESPTKIKQLWLPDLTIDYGGFKDVPRYDRCTTCHLGIERSAFDKDVLVQLGDEQESNRLTAKLITAKEELEKRERAGENLGFSTSDLPGERQGNLGMITLILLGCVLIAAFSLGILQQSMRLGMVTMFVGLGITLLTSVSLAVFSPRVTRVKAIKLEPSQVSQYAAHPRLDLFVDSNSPHPMQKFGCTICHAGQGSATEFNLASHTPNDALQNNKWSKDYHYHPSHYWDFPMLSKRFIESSCLKCHHEVTDLVRQGGKEEAPKLLRGYNLVREMGCFGCHEIHGIKSGRPVGPDLRLEPSPALEFLTAADQEKANSDPMNPPGTYRKVGPSLRRLAEKTDQDWLVKWINDPRGFRADTRMPHFYNLSTNSKDTLPEDQKNFPAAEMQAISHYLIQESKLHLDGKDTYRMALLAGKKNLPELQAQLIKSGLSDRDLKELYDVSRRFTDLALLSSPMKVKAINDASLRQRQLQDKLVELHQRGLEAPGVKEGISSSAKELEEVTTTLIEAGKATSLLSGLINGDGDKVSTPQKPGDVVNGRRLFTEKGCLACHAHQGTTTPEQKDGKTLVGAVASEANFGPELSRIANKLSPAVDKLTAQTWLVQWLLNPNVYHPRTRMPITHLSVSDANDIATWLLTQKSDWKGKTSDPATPTLEDYKALARVYLGKAPGITRVELDEFLPPTGDKLPGIPKERMAGFSRDSEERSLQAGQVTVDTLKWYIGKKAIGRLGCYGCHDVPGFETAKPIGVGLNDWGKKEGERIAFEDGAAFAKTHFNIVPSRMTRADVEARIKALEAKMEQEPSKKTQAELDNLKLRLQNQQRILELENKALATGLNAKESADLEQLLPQKLFEPAKESDGKVKEPFEEYFYHALEHHQRDGFLHLKLTEPRSYDYNRIRPWDDRLRMPQFKFARSRAKPGETPEAHEARLEKEEAEAREAVMTFILGLVAEPVPTKYLHDPTPDKKAEIVGRQVLEKFNCAGCHQIRPGVFEFKGSSLQGAIDRSYNFAAGENGRNFLGDHIYQNHNAWFGPAQNSDVLTAYGYRDALTTEKAQDIEGLFGSVAIRLSDAFRFMTANGVTRNMPEGTYLYLPQGSFKETDPYGGAWTDLMVPYLAAKDSSRFPRDDAGKARTVLPPPLLREGERVQPDWLYKFLLNPQPVRPQYPESSAGILLRMPKFNMSSEDSKAIVNYFAAVSRMGNPGAGITAPYVFIEQRDPEYWKKTAVEYDQSVQRQLASAKKELAAVKGNAEKEKAWQTRIQLIEGYLKQKDAVPAAAKVKDLYSRQAYKLLTHKDLCLKCHSIGSAKIEGAQGPNLSLASERLRPEWVEQWVAHPTRMFPYAPVMPQNFPNNPDPLQWTYQDTFVGTPLQQTRAARDLIMDLPRLNDLLTTSPPNTAPAPAGAKK